jgi:hypothetical protein
MEGLRRRLRETGATISAEMAARIARGNRRIANTPAPSHKLTG